MAKDSPTERKKSSKDHKHLWQNFKVVLEMQGQFGASLPRTEKEIRAMLENRMPKNPPPDYIPIDELVGQVVEEVGAEVGDEGPAFGWLTFKRDPQKGLYYEGRCVRGHLKDCAQQVAGFFEDIKYFRAKFINKVYVQEDHIYLNKEKPDGTEERFIQVMTRQGPRSTIKYVDYLVKPTIAFTLMVLNDELITIEHLTTVLEYGSVHGLGAERSQGWGRYTFQISKK